MSTAPSCAKHGAIRFPSSGLLALVGLLGLLGLLAGCRSARVRDVPAFVLEIEALNRHLEQHFASGNLLGVADMYTDDAVLSDAQGVRTIGRTEIDRYWSSIEVPVDWSLDVRTIRGSNAVAYQLGRSHLTTRRDGELHTSSNDFLLVWRRQEEGEWRIEMDLYWPRELH
jgi:uncharacterized protein (TIGR02246 family)